MKCSIINTKKNNYLKLEFKDKLYKFSPTWLIENSKDLSIRDKQTNQLLIEAAEIKLSLRIDAFNIKNNNLTLIEIILAGILFGILLNTLYLFFTSKYFRDIKI